MDAEHKPKHKVLQDFTSVLSKRNPMQLSRENPLEYESEALSILSRFNESALQLAGEEAVVAQVATGIVKQALEFWFDDISGVDPEPIARDLLAVYRISYGQEPEEQAEVSSVTIGG